MKKVILIVFVFLIMIYDCSSPQTNPAETKKAESKLVKSQAVTTRKLVEKLQLPGTLRAENVANILSTVEGKISRLLVREGDQVQANAVVAMISPLMREDIINSARLLVQARQEELEKNPNDPVLQDELEQARQDYQFALQQYKEITVTSPIAGVVSQRWIDLGDMVPAKVKLFEIQSNNKLLADVPVSELYIRRLKSGQMAEIYADACPEKTFQGVIQRIYPQVDAKTRNGLIEIYISDPCPSLKSGMFVRVTFVTRTIDDAIAIPISAVIERPQKKICFVIEEGKAREVVIKTGLESEGWVQILEGLTPGDKLIVEGQEQLKTGNLVRVQEASKTADQPAGGKR